MSGTSHSDPEPDPGKQPSGEILMKPAAVRLPQFSISGTKSPVLPFAR
jgi:hypothetical protein